MTSLLIDPASSASGDPADLANDLRATRVRALSGPNYWRLAPVIACDVVLGRLEGVNTASLPGFVDRLLAALPSLHEHPCTRGKPGGFVDRLREGTELPHVIEHVALELQTLSGSDVGFGRVVASEEPGKWSVIVSYDEEDLGVAAMHETIALVRCMVAGTPHDTPAAVAELQSLRRAVHLGPSTGAIVDEARRRNIPVRRLNAGSLVQLGLGRHLKRIQAAMTDNTSAIAVEIAQDKDDTKRVLGNVGLAVPHGGVARTLEGAVAIAEEAGYPVLLKPLDASQGRGISARLDDEAAVRAAWPATAALGSRVVVERWVSGRDYRVLVVNGCVVACAERVPAHVVGDGTSTVGALIEIANRDPRRGIGHASVLTRLPVDEQTVEFLAREGRTLETVPEAGERVFLRATANLSTGGTSIDRTDELHPDNVTACQIAAGVVGLDIAGVDVLTPDISVPFRENGAVIIEVNAAPGIRMHTHPAEGMPRNVAAPMLDMLFPPGAPVSIPVIAVTGTNGKTTTTRLIAHLFRTTGKTVGFTTTDGIYLQNRQVMEGDMTGPFSANVVLSNPTVDVAVLETARGGILRAGLGYEECDVGVVLNVTADHLGLGGIHTLEQLADVKGVIPAVVRREGHAVLNADDPLVYAMRERTPGDVVLFSTADEPSPRITAHLARGGIAAVVEDGWFVIRRGRLRIPVATEGEVPLMVGGAARFQRENVLAAMAAAYVQGVRYDDIRAGLRSFFPSSATLPGRLNLVRRRDGSRVLVDYAHNPAALAGLIDMVLRIPADHRVAVVTAPGDRRDEDIITAGRALARFDHVFVREDRDRRGRTPGAVAELLRTGLQQGGMTDAQIEIVLDEPEAVRRAVLRLGAHDLLVVLSDTVPETLRLVDELAAPVAPMAVGG
ncbi:MAG: cyanophycin synthetase [Gemmatirosa sp.]